MSTLKDWLIQLEKDCNIEILYACEAGSRAWGTDSLGSDQDIRFIYRYKDIKSYLSIDEPESVIEFTTPFDAVGWDIRKVLKLIRKSNPSLFEWAFSPIVYLGKEVFLTNLRTIILEGYSPYSLALHYFHLLSRNLKEIKPKNEFTAKEQKKLIQALRAFFAVKVLLFRKSVTDEALIMDKIPIEIADFWGISFQQLITAKKQGMIISTIEAKKLLSALDETKLQLENQLASLNRGEDLTIELNGWLYKLLQL